MKSRRFLAFAVLFVIGTGLTLYAMERARPVPLPVDQEAKISRHLKSVLSRNGLRQLVGEAVTNGGSGGGTASRHEWKRDLYYTLEFPGWDFPRDDALPDFCLQIRNSSTGSDAHRIQVVDLGGNYNHLLIDSLTDLFERNQWDFDVSYSGNIPERVSLVKRRLVMRQQYRLVKEIIDQVATNQIPKEVDSSACFLDLSPGRGKSEQRDSWSYELDRDMYPLKPEGGVDRNRSEKAYGVRVEGGLARDGIATIQVIISEGKFNQRLTNELTTRFEKKEWTFEILHAAQANDAQAL